MPFPFSFALNVPGIANPFAPPSPTPQSDDHSLLFGPGHREPPMINTREYNARRQIPSSSQRRPRPSPSPSPPPGAPQRRKRGWEPSVVELSEAMTMTESTSGFLDTPAKYREATGVQSSQEDEMITLDMPPAKRRRGLAGSIVTTALSAALIGAAVGMTVYKLWRDRGKEPESANASSPPPPPYEEKWAKPPSQDKPTTVVTPPTPRKARRHAAASNHRPMRNRRRGHSHSVSNGSGVTISRHASPTISHGQSNVPVEEEPEVDDQMDWIGDKISKLIEEGKRALGQQVVVMSESREDEVDDGSGDWEEVELRKGSPTRSFGSLRNRRRAHSRPADLVVPSPSASLRAQFASSASASAANLDFNTSLNSPSAQRYPSPLSSPIGTRIPLPESAVDDASSSPMVREAMEKARAAMLERRAAMRSGF